MKINYKKYRKNKELLGILDFHRLLKSFSDKKQMNILAFYFKAKTIHKNSTFYNYKVEEIAKKTGISPNSARKYISVLKKYNLVRILNKNSTFISFNYIKDFTKLKMVKSNGSIKEISYLLYCRLIELKINQIKFQQKKAKLENKEVHIGYRHLSDYLNLSLFKVSDIINYSINNKVFDINKKNDSLLLNIKKDIDINIATIKEQNTGYIYKLNNQIRINKGTSFKLIKKVKDYLLKVPTLKGNGRNLRGNLDTFYNYISISDIKFQKAIERRENNSICTNYI